MSPDLLLLPHSEHWMAAALWAGGSVAAPNASQLLGTALQSQAPADRTAWGSPLCLSPSAALSPCWECDHGRRCRWVQAPPRSTRVSLCRAEPHVRAGGQRFSLLFLRDLKVRRLQGKRAGWLRGRIWHVEGGLCLEVSVCSCQRTWVC